MANRRNETDRYGVLKLGVTGYFSKCSGAGGGERLGANDNKRKQQIYLVQAVEIAAQRGMRVLAACNVPDATHRTQRATQSTRRTRSTRSTAYSDRSVQQYNGRCNANRAHRQFAESGTPASSAHSGAIVRFRPPSVCLSVVHSTAALTGRIGSGRIGSGAAPVRSRCSCSASACACSACVSECIHGRRCLGGDRLRAVMATAGGRTRRARRTARPRT